MNCTAIDAHQLLSFELGKRIVEVAEEFPLELKNRPFSPTCKLSLVQNWSFFIIFENERYIIRYKQTK
jgi:hypothetical protein